MFKIEITSLAIFISSRGYNQHFYINLVYRYNQLLKQKVQLEDLEKVLKVEQEKMLQQSKKHETVAAEYKKLCDENDR